MEWDILYCEDKYKIQNDYFIFLIFNFFIFIFYFLCFYRMTILEVIRTLPIARP